MNFSRWYRNRGKSIYGFAPNIMGLDDAKEELERVEKLKQAKSEVEQAIS
ncbi:MAG: hypothetical protein UH963_00385 [Agathobacter sp.]|nr:hypothetical protein [Agathobacter sp.]